MESFVITNTTATRIPRIPFHTLKDSVLGDTYAVSLVFVTPARARAINTTWRKKTYTPNVLAFQIDERVGEIYVCPTVAKREADSYGHTYRTHIAYLFIHALLHLKGHRHGDTMERAETRLLQRFGFV